MVEANKEEGIEQSQLEALLDKPKEEKESIFSRIPDYYFKPKSFEKYGNGRIYELLGINYFKKAFMGTIGRGFRALGMDNQTSNYFIGKFKNRYTLEKFLLNLQFNESIHMPVAAAAYICLIGNLSISGNLGMSCFYGAMALFNSYLVFLQRYHRVRINKVLDKMEKKKK